MRQQRPLTSSLLVGLALLLPASSSAQPLHRYTVGLFGGFAGTTGTKPASTTVDETFLSEDSFESGYQLLFNMEVRRGILFGARLGRFDVGIENFASPLGPVASELTYATLAGEYVLSAGHYQSGLFFGTGYYAVDGKGFFDDDSGLGLNVGTTGDFRLNDRLSVLLEISGHYADLNYAQFFIMAHLGLAFHF